MYYSLNSSLTTGPSANIGNSSAYHVDVKFKNQYLEGDWDGIVKMMDTMAQGYADNGQRIEFSNSAVSGKVWNPNLDQDEKIALAKEVIAAHNHSKSIGSMDFYIVDDSEENRFDKAGSTPRDMQLAIPKNGSVEYASADNYGNFAIVKDENGKEIMRMGHGDNAKAVPDNFKATPEFLNAQGLGSQDVAGNTQIPQNSWLNSDASQEKPTGLPTTRQVKTAVDDNGADDTYKMFSEMFTGGQDQDVGGGLFTLLFMMIMTVMGEEPVRGANGELNEEQRRDQLREADDNRTIDIENGQPDLSQGLQSLIDTNSVQPPDTETSLSSSSELLPPLSTPRITASSSLREPVALS